MMTEIKIETARLVIRPFQEKDSAGYFDLYKAPTVHCFMPDKISTFAAARNIVLTKETQRATEMAVCLKDTDTFIGTLFGHWEDAGTYSICWHFLSDYNGKGYATEAAKAFIDFLFEAMQARRIYAYVEVDNASSLALCRRLGMRHEGTHKDFISFVNNPDGSPYYETTMVFAILKKEWPPVNQVN